MFSIDYDLIRRGPRRGRCNGCMHLESVTLFDGVEFAGSRYWCNQTKTRRTNSRTIGSYDRAFPDVTCPNWCPVVKH